jgi:hypothetical protein
MFAGPPWSWPPSVTREQSMRDLELILDALDDAEVE